MSTFNKEREALAIKHKTEKNELTKQHTKAKKQAKSGNKAEQKACNKKCMQEVEDLKIRHKNEVEALQAKFGVETSGTIPNQPTESSLDFDQISIQDQPENSTKNSSEIISNTSKSKPKKISKAEKIRRRKEREEQELRERIEAAKLEEARNFGKDDKYLESFYLKKHVENLGLSIVKIKADGSCLFNSVLKSAKQDLGISSDKLRLAVANHIEANPNDYSGFLEENLATYLPKLKAGETWGGEVEISVISKLYKMKISILQWTNGQKSCSVQDFCNFEGEAENSCHILFYKYLMSSCHYDGTK